MAGSTPSSEDAHENAAFKEYELNLEMWRHYDNLRQEKSKTFLTAQTILIAVSGFVFQSGDPDSALQGIFLAISLLGAGSSGLWFLLLFRNAGYIRFHRDRVVELEKDAGIPFTTFGKKWDMFDKDLWPKSWANKKDAGPLVKVFGSSNMIDRLLALLFVLFWLCLSSYG